MSRAIEVIDTIGNTVIGSWPFIAVWLTNEAFNEIRRRRL